MADTSNIVEDIVDPGGEEAHEFGALNTLLFVVVLAVCFLFAYLIKKLRLFYLPESAAVILLGVFVGFLASKLHPSTAELDLMTFQPEFFYFGLLPPLIFDAGYTCRRKAFFQNFLPIMLYAVLGTFVSAFFVGYCTLSLGRMGWVDMDTSNPIEALLFGTLISAVNPVATLSVMDMIMGSESPGENCDPLLYSLIFGESVLNDAVAIVLFHTFSKFHDNPEKIDDRLVVRVLSSFVFTSLGSVATGTAIALLCSYFCRNSDVRNHPELELSLLFLFAYGAYALAEALELSGIMALFFCGIVLAHYNSYNLSAKSRATAEVSAKMLSQLSENFVFLYMGMGFFTGRFKHWDARFITAVIVLCLIARMFNTFPLTTLANRFRSPRKKISGRMQIVIWFSGLRGAIAFALSQTMPESHRDLWVCTTLSVVIFTTVVCGGLTEPLLNATSVRRTDATSVASEKAHAGAGLGLLTDSSDSDSDDSDESSSLLSSAPVAYPAVANTGTSPTSAAALPVDPSLTEKGSKGGSGSTAAVVASRRRHKLSRPGRRRGIRAFWRDFDERFVKPTFGGSSLDVDAGSSPAIASASSPSHHPSYNGTANSSSGSRGKAESGDGEVVSNSAFRDGGTVSRFATSSPASAPLRTMSSSSHTSGALLSPVPSGPSEDV